MRNKLVATPNVPDFHKAKSVQETKTILERIPNETYPEAYYLTSIEKSKFDFLDDSQKDELANAMKSVGFHELGGMLTYLSNKTDVLVELINKSSSLKHHVENILQTLKSGFPILPVQKMLEDTPVCFGIVELNGSMIWANKGATDALGMPIHDVIGKSIISVAHNYDFTDILSNQIFNGDFNSYPITWVDVEGKMIPALVLPGPIVAHMTYGTILPLDNVFVGKYGKNVFADKNMELVRSNKDHRRFSSGIAQLLKQHVNNNLTQQDVMQEAKTILNADQSFVVDLKTSPSKLSLLSDGEMIEKPIEKGPDGLISHISRYPYLHLSEKQSYTHKLLNFIPNYEAINSSIIVPIGTHEDGKLSGLLGVSRNQGQLTEGVDLDVAYTWLTSLSSLIKLMSSSPNYKVEQIRILLDSR